MSWSLLSAACWLAAGNIMAMIPSRDNLWQRAYFLMATGLPIAVWLFFEGRLLIGVLFLLAAASLLRWPLIYLWRWVRGQGATDD